MWQSYQSYWRVRRWQLLKQNILCIPTIQEHHSKKVAVDDVNLEIEQGEFVGVIGHTGSGKSTLIQHLNGLLAPSSEKYMWMGEDI